MNLNNGNPQTFLLLLIQSVLNAFDKNRKNYIINVIFFFNYTYAILKYPKDK